jgi:hypothetical protein
VGELARVTLRTVWNWSDPSGELEEEAKQALARATALAPDLPQVEMARATYLTTSSATSQAHWRSRTR